MSLLKENSNYNSLVEYCLRIADDRMILGQVLAESCGHLPMLEEDIAITNISLDLIGQATSFYEYSAELLGNGETADNLVFFRGEREFKNILLVEQDNSDFAYLIVKQFLFDSFDLLFMEALTKSHNEQFAAIAAKAYKESLYHFRHTKSWVIRLGDGTDESNSKINEALEFLWMYVGEMFEIDEVEESLIKENIAVNTNLFKDKWLTLIKDTFKEATLIMPNINDFMQTGGRKGRHTECLGHILAEMQYIPRAYPTANW